MLTDLPNVLTISRIAAIPIIAAMTALHTATGDLIACIVFGLAGLTDYLDGRLARDRSQTSDVGRMLDPIADKLLVGAALMLLAAHGRLSTWGLYPAIIILAPRDPRQRPARIPRRPPGRPPRHHPRQMEDRLPNGRAWARSSPATTPPSILHLSFLPVASIGEAMLWVAAVLTLVTGWDYLKAGLRHATTPSGAFPRR